MKKLSPLLVFLALGCQKRDFNASQTLENESLPLISFFEPVDKWTGNLILPEKRFEDGSVYIELKNYDKTKVSSSKMRLLWKNAPFSQGMDVTFTKDVYDYAGPSEKEEKNPVAWNLNGKKNIKALESLAGHRVRLDDPMEVSLQNPKIEKINGEDVLVIDQEPLQIVGTHYTLLKFITSDSQKATVQLWNKKTQKFDGPVLELSLPQALYLQENESTKEKLPMSNLDKIHESALNEKGWYAYGHFDKTFELRGLEPRELFQLKTQNIIQNKNKGIEFIDNMWNDDLLNKNHGKISSHYLSEKSFQGEIGKKYFVLNLFGWWGLQGKTERNFPVRSGHFSFGEAVIKKDPFTNEPRLHIHYQQVYGVHTAHIVAGNTSWANYNGHLLRGWMYLRPNYDILVDIPELTENYSFKNKTISPLRIIQDRLEYVMAAYRTGAGVGAPLITGMNSCIQDSIQGLFLGMETIFNDEKEFAESLSKQRKNYDGLEDFRRWAEDYNNSDPLAQKWRSLKSIYRKNTPFDAALEKSLTTEFFRIKVAGFPLGQIWRSDWKENLKTRDSFTRANNDAMGPKDIFLGHIQSRNSVMPRRGTDALAKVFLENKNPLWILGTFQIGGKIPHLDAYGPQKMDDKFFIDLFKFLSTKFTEG